MLVPNGLRKSLRAQASPLKFHFVQLIFTSSTVLSLPEIFKLFKSHSELRTISSSSLVICSIKKYTIRRTRPPVPGTRESKTPTRGSLQKKIMELKRTVKNMGSTVKQTETKITALRAQSDGLSNELEDMQLKSSQWESKAKEIDEMITRMEEDKHVVSSITQKG